ncbi:MAG: GNAT family N-acetyltransferase [Desulfobacteraceae bacterium]|nr:GNAT family N-acetyltransferase [Desulfobacteraceae bacterium]
MTNILKHKNIIIRQISVNTPQVQVFIRDLDEYQESLYPSESNHLDSIETLMQPNVFFVGAMKKNELIGIGAVKLFKTYGEIKRMFIPNKFRGKGIGKIILQALENHLIQQKIFTITLETGIHQTPAIRLYETMGYARTSPFGNYIQDPLSIFMEKKLPNPPKK